MSSPLPPPPVLLDELIEEVLLRLPPDEPVWLVRASAVCKPWRRILAAPRFRRRYQKFHGTPPMLGFFKVDATFVPTSALFPAQPDHPGRITMDCRHGRALFLIPDWETEIFDLVVLDPVTGHQRRVPSPYDHITLCSAAVLCAAQGCDHNDCQGGNFLVAVVTTDESEGFTSGWLYSSESHAWSELTSVHHPNVSCSSHIAQGSVLVGDTIYFEVDDVIECQVGTLRLSMFEKPTSGHGALMTAEGGELGFAAMVDATNVALWSMEIGPEGSKKWAKIRVINLKLPLSDQFPVPNKIRSLVKLGISGFAEGTQVIFVRTLFASYMVDLKSGRARMVTSYVRKLFPYMRFNFPAMDVASTGRG